MYDEQTGQLVSAKDPSSANQADPYAATQDTQQLQQQQLIISDSLGNQTSDRDNNSIPDEMRRTSLQSANNLDPGAAAAANASRKASTVSSVGGGVIRSGDADPYQGSLPPSKRDSISGGGGFGAPPPDNNRDSSTAEKSDINGCSVSSYVVDNNLAAAAEVLAEVAEEQVQDNGKPVLEKPNQLPLR